MGLPSTHSPSSQGLLTRGSCCSCDLGQVVPPSRLRPRVPPYQPGTPLLGACREPMKRGGETEVPPEKGRDHGLRATGAGRTSGFPGSLLLRVLGLRGRAGGGRRIDRSRCRRAAPGEQQRQVVASRPRRQVPPVAYFSPDAAAGVGFRGVKSSDWSPGLLGLREEGDRDLRSWVWGKRAGPGLPGLQEEGAGTPASGRWE